MTGLTDAERKTLRDSWWCAGSTVEVLDAMTAAVEAILSARLARVEALADEWEADPHQVLFGDVRRASDRVLRAVLAAEAEGA